jgi:hypothetical protein
MTIAPGNNTLPMTAYVNKTQIVSAMDSEGFVDLIITGTSAVYNGQHIVYYVCALFNYRLHRTDRRGVYRKKLLLRTHYTST